MFARATHIILKKCRRRGEASATLFDLTGPRFEPQAYRSRDERATARTADIIQNLHNSENLKLPTKSFSKTIFRL